MERWEGDLDFVADGVGDGRDHLGVEHHCCGLVGEFFEDLGDVIGGDGGEFRDAAVDEEALEAADAGFDEGPELGCVAWDDAAVKADVDPTLAFGGSCLLAESVEGCCGGNGVQGHVNDCCDAAECRGLGTGEEAFPFCTAGFIEMDVCVDEAGE